MVSWSLLVIVLIDSRRRTQPGAIRIFSEESASFPMSKRKIRKNPALSAEESHYLYAKRNPRRPAGGIGQRTPLVPIYKHSSYECRSLLSNTLLTRNRCPIFFATIANDFVDRSIRVFNFPTGAKIVGITMTVHYSEEIS